MISSPAGQPPSAALSWKARPIFISSTFRDMHAERDHLRSNGFLRLAELLRERCHNLDTIDLRQGVETASEADAAKREMQVLKVCLDEINRSKPFLVGLLGERYGHIPPADRITAAARDAGLPDSVDVDGKSVTELEILYAVLENKDQQKRSWFYFRTIDRTDMPPEMSDKFPAETPSDDPRSPAGRLKALKDRIRRELPGRVREYTLKWDPTGKALVGLKELDDRIVQDLWSDLEVETAAYLRAAPKTWQEADARAVTDFVTERIRGYVDRPAVTDPMIAQALTSASEATGSVPLDSPWGLVVTGESGSGKSSLFGRAYASLQQRAESGEIVLLAHAAGIFPMSGQVDRMLKRWVTELAVRLGVPDPIAEMEDANKQSTEMQQAETKVVTSEQIEKSFVELLGQVSTRKRVVVLIDALNQFEPTVRAEYMTWLPKWWPENARLIATAIPGKATAALKERKGCRELSVPSVTDAEAREIALRFYRERHHRDLNPNVANELLAKQLPDGRPAHGNPLWLALALQEMNLLEADDYERAERDYADLPGAERMQALQLDEAVKFPADVTGAYAELLARAERGFGKTWADAFVDLIAVSRSGWRESDLKVLMPKVSRQPWDDLAFAAVRRSLGAHVAQRGAQSQWDFFHAALRNTILKRNFADESKRAALHGMIANQLQSLPPDDPLRISETMFHLIGLGDSDRAAKYLAAHNSPRTVDKHSQSALHASMAVLVAAIESTIDDSGSDRLTSWIVELLRGDDDERRGHIANLFVWNLNNALKTSGQERAESARRRILEATTSTLLQLYAKHSRNEDIARCLMFAYNEAGHLHHFKGDLSKALNYFEQSLVILKALRANNLRSVSKAHDLAVQYYNLGNIHCDLDNDDQALLHHKKACHVFAQLHELRPQDDKITRDLSASQARVGDCYGLKRNMSESGKFHQLSLQTAELLLTRNPQSEDNLRSLIIRYKRMGRLHAIGDNLNEAWEFLQKSVNMVDELCARNPERSDLSYLRLQAYLRLGDSYREDDRTKAVTSYNVALSIAMELVTRNQSSVAFSRAVLRCYLCLAKIQDDLWSNSILSLDVDEFSPKVTDECETKRLEGQAQYWWRKAYDLLNAMKERDLLHPEDEKLFPTLRRKLGEAESKLHVTRQPALDLHTAQPMNDGLRASAETMYNKCLWDAASSVYEKLLAAGDPVEEVGPKLVKCLLNIHKPPTPGEVKRAKEVVGQLDAKGRSDLVDPFRQILTAKQPPEKRGIWRLFREKP